MVYLKGAHHRVCDKNNTTSKVRDILAGPHNFRGMFEGWGLVWHCGSLQR